MRSDGGVVGIQDIVGGHGSIAGVNIDYGGRVSGGGDVDGLGGLLGSGREVFGDLSGLVVMEVIGLSGGSGGNGSVNGHNGVSGLLIAVCIVTDRLQVSNLDATLQFGGQIFIKPNGSPTTVIKLHSVTRISSDRWRRMNSGVATMAGMVHLVRLGQLDQRLEMEVQRIDGVDVGE